MAKEALLRGEVSAGGISPETGPVNPFDTHEHAGEFLRRFYAGQRAEREVQQEAMERAEGILADLEGELFAQADALGLSREEWAAAMAGPNFRDIYRFCIENPELTWAEAQVKWAAEQKEEDARWDQQLGRLNRGSNRKFPPKELQRIDRAEGERRSHWKPPTKTGLTGDPRMVEKLKLRVARKEARRTRATATEEQIAAAINVEKERETSVF